MTVIDVRGLVKRYSGRTVVDHLSMTVSKGEISGFLGPNGSGKTTTIRMMCGLLTPDGGEGHVLGYDIRRQRRQIKRQVGYMTQRFSFYEDLTIEENLMFVARLYKLQPPRARVRDTLSELGLTARRKQLAGALSGGWKQRLALAACLMHRPRLLLLDEPTSGVDPEARREFWDEIHARAAEGMTVLVSTHYMDEAERCDQIHYIAHGRLVVGGTVAEVVASAGLSTYVLEGENLTKLAPRLANMPGVDQVATFGTSLHVVGKSATALRSTIDTLTKEGIRARQGKTSLEDVFIQLMGKTEGAEP